MSNSTTYPSQALRPASTGVGTALLRELFAATPLYIFWQAVNAPKQNTER